jgi:hypothetical protein
MKENTNLCRREAWSWKMHASHQREEPQMPNKHPTDSFQGIGEGTGNRVVLTIEHIAEIAKRYGLDNRRKLKAWLKHGLRKALDAPSVQSDEAYADEAARHVLEIELFSALAETAPQDLRGQWAFVYGRIKGNGRYWAYPSACPDGESGGTAPQTPEPTLNRNALSASWQWLLDDAESQLIQSQR